jgi:adenylate kinase
MLFKREAVIFLGPPGSGKSTIADAISSRRGSEMIETGQLLRREVEKGTSCGERLKLFLDEGRLAPSDLVGEVIKSKLGQIDKEPILFDGFPRRIDEVEPFFQICKKENISLSAVILLQVPRSLAIKRLTGRRICPQCHAVYNIHFAPPKQIAICDSCGTPLEKRKDDRVDLVTKRLDVYHRETLPVEEYFKIRHPLITCETPVESSLENNVKAVSKVIERARGHKQKT